MHHHRYHDAHELCQKEKPGRKNEQETFPILNSHAACYYYYSFLLIASSRKSQDFLSFLSQVITPKTGVQLHIYMKNATI